MDHFEKPSTEPTTAVTPRDTNVYGRGDGSQIVLCAPCARLHNSYQASNGNGGHVRYKKQSQGLCQRCVIGRVALSFVQEDEVADAQQMVMGFD